jgi:integrase
MNFLKIPNKKGDKIIFYHDFGRGKGQRSSTGIFMYKRPKNQIEKNHNKEALKLLEVKKSQLTIEKQAIGTPYIPKHKFKENFLDFYADYVEKHRSEENRHLPCSLTKFKLFIGKDFISPIEITEDFCKQFRKYLLDNLTGETPQNYFARFKWVINAATKAKYFVENPVENVNSKANPSVALKEIVEVEDYLGLLSTPCSNEEISYAFIFCLYTGLRWVDVSKIKWPDFSGGALTTRMIQSKTGQPVVITLHPTALRILDKQKAKHTHRKNAGEFIFSLPSANGANKMLGLWIQKAGIRKKITWSCARLSFSVLLQDKNVDNATVAYLLGHTTTKQVEKVYKRHRPKDQRTTISNLPDTTQEPVTKSIKLNFKYNGDDNWAALNGANSQGISIA